VHREGEEGLGAVKPREVRLGQGRAKGAASPACRSAAVGNRRPRGTCPLGMGGFGAGEGDSVAGLSGPIAALPFGTAHRQASPARWPAAAGPRRDRTGRERERSVKEERERVKA
jgi:hypothetical protein